MNKFIYGFFILCVIVLGVWFFLPQKSEYRRAESDSDENVVVKIGYRQHVFYAPLFVAIDRGFFSAYGVQVEPVAFESTNQMVDALLSGRIDAALGGVNTFIIFNVAEKSPGSLKIFTVAQESRDNPLTFLLTRKESGIESISDLEGRVVGSFLGSTVKALYRKMVSENGISRATLQQMSPRLELQALESGQVDAIIAIEPIAAIGAQKGISIPIESALFDTYFLSDIPLAASVVRGSFINEYPEVVKRMVSATEDSIQFIHESPNETRNIIARYTPLSDEVSSEVRVPTFYMMSSEVVQKLNQLKQVLVEEGEIEGTVDVGDLVLEL